MVLTMGTCADKGRNIIGASLSEPHINGTAMRAIYGICMYVYVCMYMYVYIYVCMYGTSIIHAPLHRLYTGPHAIFCAEKSALKNNCNSML